MLKGRQFLQYNIPSIDHTMDFSNIMISTLETPNKSLITPTKWKMDQFLNQLGNSTLEKKHQVRNYHKQFPVSTRWKHSFPSMYCMNT